MRRPLSPSSTLPPALFRRCRRSALCLAPARVARRWPHAACAFFVWRRSSGMLWSGGSVAQRTPGFSFPCGSLSLFPGRPSAPQLSLLPKSAVARRSYSCSAHTPPFFFLQRRPEDWRRPARPWQGPQQGLAQSRHPPRGRRRHGHTALPRVRGAGLLHATTGDGPLVWLILRHCSSRLGFVLRLVFPLAHARPASPSVRRGRKC